MPWTLPLESSHSWAGATSPFALHARRRWLGEGGPEFAVVVIQATAGLEDAIFRLTRTFQRGPDPEASIPAILEALDRLYAFHLIWRVPTTPARELLEATTRAAKDLSAEERVTLATALEASHVLPFPPGAPQELIEAAFLYFDALLPPKKGKLEIGKSLKALAARPLPTGPRSSIALAHRALALSAWSGREADVGLLHRVLPEGDLPRPVLIALFSALSASSHSSIRAWCEARRAQIGRLYPPNGNAWGDPFARDAFLIEQGARRLEWILQETVAPALAL